MNSNASIESYFLIPLEQHYEAKPKPGVRLTILSELAGCDEATMIAAVAFIKRTRKAMSFPSPAECLAAIRASKVPAIADAGDITGSNYAKKANEYAKGSGRDEFPVIKKWLDKDRGLMTGQWKAWLTYWEGVGAKSTLALVYDRDSWTVPTEWPHQFDAQAQWAVGDPVGDADAA